MVETHFQPDPPSALVTGGGRGIGRAICVALAESGWQIGINYRSDAASANETLKLVQQAGGEGFPIQADIALTADRKRLVEKYLEWAKHIDVLVNNAGMAPRHRRDLLEVEESSFDEVMGANLKGPFFLTQRVAKVMLSSSLLPSHENPTSSPQMTSEAHQLPMIINIGSMSAYTSSISRGEYCISKAGMGMMTTLFADRLASHGICVYEIRPGIINTDMTAGVTEKYDRLIAEGLTPVRRWGQPEDVALAVKALVEGRLPFSTGEVINVDGGFHMRRL